MVRQKEHIAIILARGGSRRLPNKNILEFFGKPMIAWTIQAAKESEKFDRIVISTDDKSIAGIGRKYGAEVPFLRNEKSDDIAPASEATLVALRQAENYYNEEYKFVTQLMANCPLRNSADISSAIKRFHQSKTESQISCFRFGWMNPWWAVRLDDQGKPQYLFPTSMSERSQDLPDLYGASGAIWIAKVDTLKKNGTFYSPNHQFYPLSWKSALDIDNADDLKMAKVCFGFQE